jgi:serine/threonine-protein kinase
VTARRAAFIALVLVSIVVLGVGISRRRHRPIPITPVAAVQQPKAIVADTYLEMNASPWATVMKIEDSAGNSIDLHGSQPVTPFRLDGVPSGSYVVTLKGPGSDQEQVAHCVLNAAQHLCTADLSMPETQQLLMGVQP